MPHLDDTIVAIATPPGPAAEGIVRLAGPGVARCVRRLFTPSAARHDDWTVVTQPTAIDGAIRLDAARAPLPAVLYLWPAGRSYTGGPVAEWHTIGSRPLLEAVVRQCCTVGARLAEPGEFTLRAFLAGRIDLTQAEAVLGVIDAVDDEQLDVALAQLAGGLAQPLDRLREALLDLLGHLEAGMDFADEGLPFITPEQLRTQLGNATDVAERLAAQIVHRERPGGLIRVALVGWPNVGKSSLFNALSRRVGALVSAEPGTTRDYLIATIELDGTQLELVDTAGVDTDLEGPSAEVRREAQQLATRESRLAGIRVFCLDATRPATDVERAALDQLDPDRRIVVLTKMDIAPSAVCPPGALAVSSATGQGLNALGQRLRAMAWRAGASGGAVAATAARCHESIDEAAAALRRAEQLANTGSGDELVAAELRGALDALGRVAGRVYADDVLDRVFSRFCVGK